MLAIIKVIDGLLAKIFECTSNPLLLNEFNIPTIYEVLVESNLGKIHISVIKEVSSNNNDHLMCAPFGNKTLAGVALHLIKTNILPMTETKISVSSSESFISK